MVKLYEQRQYKKSVKTADGILKKHPAHGETLAMKGLVVNAMGKRAEAYALVKEGLKHDLKSHVCWHVFGLIYKSDSNFAEAAKCYRNALRQDPENAQIQRDLALLQVHLRDLAGHVETRRALLSSKTGAAMNWLGFAVAHQLAGNVDMALAVLDRYESTLEPSRTPTAEDGEVILYQAELLRTAGGAAGAANGGGGVGGGADAVVAGAEAALALLARPWSGRAVMDELGLAEVKARLTLEAGDAAGAATAYLALVASNPDNHDFHAALQTALRRSNPSGAGVEGMVALYAAMAARHPKCRAVPWITLRCLPPSHPLFAPLLAAYTRAGIRRGIPALHSELVALSAPRSPFATWGGEVAGAAEERARAIMQLAEGCVAACKAGAAFDVPAVPDAVAPEAAVSTPLGASDRAAVAAMCRASGDGKAEAPSASPFATLLLVKCLDAAGRHAEGVAAADAGLAHSPTVLELYLAKARCLKHAGAAAAAAEAADYARSLDLADRHLNAKAVKYALRAGQVEEAEKLMALFARHDAKKPHADALSAVHDVQVLWFELEAGKALEAQRSFGRALKQYNRVLHIFGLHFEDQYDYHAYCLRRGTLRAYAAMIAGSVDARAHPTFVSAAMGAARVYLALHRDAEALERLRGEAKEAAAVATAALAKAVAAGGPAKAATEDEEEVDSGIDVDPAGVKLLAPASMLAEAWKHAKMALDALPPAASGPLRAFEAEALGAASATATPLRLAADAPSPTSARAAAVADLAPRVHLLCAEVAAEQKAAGAVATHWMQALRLGGGAVAAQVAAIAAAHGAALAGADPRVHALVEEVRLAAARAV
jgi:tetratricopeptide (TPR) repeat protein